MKRQCLILLLLLLCGVGVVPVSYAQKLYTVEETPNVHLQDETQFVTDPAGVLSGEAKQSLNAAIVKVSKDYAVQIAIVILLGMDTSRYGSDREFSNRLFRHWGVGDKETDRGLLLLLFTHPDQRVINFEVGYGLEGDLPDALQADPRGEDDPSDEGWQLCCRFGSRDPIRGGGAFEGFGVDRRI